MKQADTLEIPRWYRISSVAKALEPIFQPSSLCLGWRLDSISVSSFQLKSEGGGGIMISLLYKVTHTVGGFHSNLEAAHITECCSSWGGI